MSSSFSAKPGYRPGIIASRDQRIANAHDRSRPLLEVIENMSGATVPEMVVALNQAGHRAPRGGPVTHNTVTRALSRIGQVPPVTPRSNQSMKSKSPKNIRARARRYEVFRTPAYCYELLFDYRLDWFTGSGFDPAAGDGRMIREVIRRGNTGPHFVNDIRDEELSKMLDCGQATTGDYLTMDEPPQCNFMITNPPFTLAMKFVEKAQTHISGPICILQSIAWQGGQKRSKWLRSAGLSHILNLARRPKWEIDSCDEVNNNIWDYAWYVFLPGHIGGTATGWLIEPDTI